MGTAVGAAKSRKKIKKSPGRPKGTKNKIPTDLKRLVMETYARLEAENKGLYDEADKDPKWFLEHFIKPLLPKDTNMTVEMGQSAMEVAVKVLKGMQGKAAPTGSVKTRKAKSKPKT